MAKGPRYKVLFRRRREGKTDYRMRKKLILSGKPRLIPRFSNKYVTVQIAEARPKGDHILAAAHSREIAKKYGWLGSLDNVPAAYLTGLLAGYRATSKGIKEAILDIGLYTSSKGSRIYAVVKGTRDANLIVPCDEGAFPSEGRIKGGHIVDYAKQLLASDPRRYQARFSSYLDRKLRPESLSSHFEEVKARIMEEFRGG